MERGKVVLVPCVFLRGAFPHERVFVIRFGDGSEYRGVAPERYCLAEDRRSPTNPPGPTSETEGFIFGIQIAHTKKDLSRIQLPDGNVYDLPEDRFESLSRAEGPHVSIKS